MGLLHRFRETVSKFFAPKPPPEPVDDGKARAIALGVTIGEKIAHHYKTGRLRFLPAVDDLNETEAMRRAYRPMLADPVVLSAITSRIFGVASLDLSVTAADDDPVGPATADWVRYAIPKCKGGLRKIVETITLPGLMEGYSLGGKIKGRLDRGKHAGKLYLADLKSYDSRDYTLETDEHRNVLAVVSRQDQKTYPLSDFVYWTHLPLFENPAGMSALRCVYKAYWLLDTAYKLWAICLERFTLPILKGKYDDVSNKTALEEALKTAKSMGYIAMPKDAEVEALEMALHAGASFEAATKQFRQDIYIGITGAFLNALEGTATGSKAIGTVHADTSSLGIWYLADCVAGVINSQIVPDLVNDNQATTADYPTVSLGGVDDAVLVQALAVDEGLFRMGYESDEGELGSRYRRKVKKRPPQLGMGGQDPFAPLDQAGAPAPMNELRSTVGGSTALTALQTAYYARGIPRDAALNNAKLIFGFDDTEADQLFPELPPDAPQEGDLQQPQLATSGGVAAAPF